MESGDGSERLTGAVPVFRDERGMLTLAEFGELPFAPSRAYVLHDIPRGARRGGHAHLRQDRYLVVAAGRAGVVHDDGRRVRTFEMGPGEALHVPPCVWHEIQALEDGLVVLVLAPGEHDPEAYVEDRGEIARLAASHTASS